MKNFAAAVLAASTLAACVDTGDGYDRRVLVVNQSRKTVYHFYGSNVGTNSWQEDILGSSVLEPGQSVSINFDDGTGYCNFDFKVVFSDGSYYTDSNINVCAVSQYNIR